MKYLNVVHPYGSIGKLSWTDAASTLDFGQTDTEAINVAKEIRTFHERGEIPDARFSIRSALANARVIVFLGFYFHPQNVRLMTLPNEAGQKRDVNIYMTTCNRSAEDIVSIEARLRAMLPGSEPHFHKTQTCKSFFEECSYSLLPFA